MVTSTPFFCAASFIRCTNMLVDIPAAQHKTMFFIVSLGVDGIIDNYPSALTSTTALRRLCVWHHKERAANVKPVTT